jgi:hypothetical protein
MYNTATSIVSDSTEPRLIEHARILAGQSSAAHEVYVECQEVGMAGTADNSSCSDFLTGYNVASAVHFRSSKSP